MFGANQRGMKIVGTPIHKPLMQVLSRHDIGIEKFQQLEEAYLELFKSVVYWLQLSFNSDIRNIA